MQHAINWFEIPATDFDRAVKFYGTILNAQIRTENFGGMPNGFLPYDSKEGVGGSIVKGEGYVPATNGSVVYLNVGTPDNLDTVLSRVEAAGGKVLAPKMSIGDPGWIGFLLDSEGNKVGLHAPN
jgi:predicted enzyme related to lactoylglutathione lyase